MEEASQGWAAWAWSFVPQITADSEVTEFAESGHQQSAKKVEQSVFDVGVYIMQASVVFKVCMCTGCNIVSRMCTPFPLPSSGHRPSYDDCLEDKKETYQNCSVLCCVTVCGSCTQ